jgi:hypothetical protein
MWPGGRLPVGGAKPCPAGRHMQRFLGGLRVATAGAPVGGGSGDIRAAEIRSWLGGQHAPGVSAFHGPPSGVLLLRR